MSISNDMLKDYANFILNNPAKGEVIKRVNMRMFSQWMQEQDEVKQKDIRLILEAMGKFFNELQIITAENAELTEKEDSDAK